MKPYSHLFFVLFLFSLTLAACKTVPISDLSQTNGIDRIKKSYSEKNWSDVISDVEEYKTRYPYSRYTRQADLMQGDAYYESERYPDAIATYEDFIRKNPGDSSSAFASYRIAKSYDFQAPRDVDRDQENSKKGLQKYNLYIKNYPNTEWIKEAKERREVLNRRIADHNAFIAQFYWDKDLYAAALSRYLIILETYPNYQDIVTLAKKRASHCYHELAEMLKKKPDSDAYIFFKNETPESLEQKAQEINN